TAFGDLGFEVEVGSLFRTPDEVVQDALDAKADAIGISSLAGGHLHLVPQVMDSLKAKGRDDILVLVGGVIPQQDYDALRAVGVAAIFGPGTHIPDAARSVLSLIRARRRRNEP
ncbi:MAG TPA: cobalamin-dependent protein, partial [Rhizomicrobium sp.]